MNWLNIKIHIAKFLARDLFDSYDRDRTERNQCIIDTIILEREISNYKKQYNTLSKKHIELENLMTTSKAKNLTELDKYCHKKYKIIANKAYMNKRRWQKLPISVLLNQFIVPNQFMVKKLRNKITKGVTIRNDALNVGNKIAKDFTWTSDSNLGNSTDYYLYPEEIIVTGKGDCEDHAFTVSSLNPEIGVAYGFYKGGGHAFNAFIENNKLYVLETTGSRAKIVEYAKQTDYVIHYLITENFTYRVKGGVEFGTIANYK